ncbi:hypothetical protein KKE19_03550 [Patescibacteria group bacterium]|nr:hypothetical protein [Patescibacteria group bacterium]MBU4274861.1 hypothetical protein [Patescibacteria group bacterium]MBU4367970.1 hypothetical protein [Patescibacteria group bacterium]MBU4462151.1 hypothetical protein [Patescibacteria group bacterium]MCG2699813.1 hypothetical protein [Candidatus Parcubacteria bacterium]
MDITFDNIYQKYADIFSKHTIDISNLGWCDPWVIGLVCLKAIEYKDEIDKGFILTKDTKILSYLKRMHLDAFLEELTYSRFLGGLKNLEINEKENLNVQEILHCEFRDNFDARLSSRIKNMFTKIGMNEKEGSMATALVGELGNNVFDHNEGLWPTNVRGAIILAQNNPIKNKIEVVVADPGVGFQSSLRLAEPSPNNDIDAIKLGLSGVTGRIGEPRGNGLRVIQEWTIEKFDGIVKIHSGTGLIVVDKNGQNEKTVFPILGSLTSFVVKYNS